MKKKSIASFLKNFFIFLIPIIFTVCEPLGVSVNKEGEVAFTRSEGVFYFNTKSAKLTLMDWNFGKESIPALIKWAPDGNMLSFTVRENKDSQKTVVYTINKKNEMNKVYSSSGIITQIEWSPDQKYLSIAQAGADSETGAADIALVSVNDGLSKILLENTGDVHKWLDAKNIAFIKVLKKNPENTDIYSGELSIYNTEKNAVTKISALFVLKTLSIDVSSVRNEVVFTAIQADVNEDFSKEMKGNTYLFSYNFKDKKVVKVSEDIINFAEYSPDGARILIKNKQKAEDPYSLSLIDPVLKKNVLLIKNTVDTVSSSSVPVQVYPGWFSNESVLYWMVLKNYSSNGETLNLMRFNLATGKKENLQPLIDMGVNKIVEEKGGY